MTTCKLTSFPNCCLEVQLSRVIAKLYHHLSWDLISFYWLQTFRDFITDQRQPCPVPRPATASCSNTSLTNKLIFSCFSAQLDQQVDPVCSTSSSTNAEEETGTCSQAEQDTALSQMNTGWKPYLWSINSIASGGSHCPRVTVVLLPCKGSPNYSPG